MTVAVPGFGYDDGDRLVRLETAQGYTTDAIDRLAGKFELLERRFSSRPSWGVVVAFALMQAIIGILATGLVLSVTAR